MIDVQISLDFIMHIHSFIVYFLSLLVTKSTNWWAVDFVYRMWLFTTDNNLNSSLSVNKPVYNVFTLTITLIKFDE